MARAYRRTGAGNGDDVLDLYEYAYLAGGERRVVESAIISLVEHGTLSLRAARLRTIGAELPQHPVERAVIAACPRSKRVREVFEALGHCDEVDELARRLVLLGLVGNWRRRTTRAGRRRLAAAVAEGSLPPYVLEGPARLDPGPVQYGLFEAAPDGLGRTLRRMGKALDNESDHHAHAHAEGGFSCGGGGGGD
ncbi:MULTISPECIES: TIGR04222 domain-containing membrane protein [unclassified Streptomyces]|uniref:TIGR04222 domain-containing membrane protein n=1 Tax=unclassified Streptomyces TaxID=2593676 RepID=UPI002E2831C7|nr:TIGR04222 domain-containing membrane protein [Streptomyces sp. NBC_01439]